MLEKPKGTIKNGPMKRQWKYWAHKTKCRQRTNKNTQHRKLKIWRDTDHTEKPGVNPCAREGSAVPASYKTLVVLLMYTVKSGKNIGSDRGKKTST